MEIYPNGMHLKLQICILYLLIQYLIFFEDRNRIYAPDFAQMKSKQALKRM